MNNIILEAKNISKSYDNGKNKLEVLSNINLKLNDGDIITIIGKSGAGKSTLLNILSTLDKPDSGILRINNQLINDIKSNDLSMLRNRSIGFVFQFHHLLTDFTVLENLLMPVKIGNNNVNIDWVSELLVTLDIKNIKNQYPSDISGGERQRVAVSRALINKPDILFADEPTGNLDEKNSLKMVDLFRKINRDYGVNIILTTHNPEVSQIGNKKYNLSRKEISLIKE